MKSLLLCAAIMAGQMITLQDRPVVHLVPNRSSISSDFGGKLLELINAPSTVSLPADPPRLDSKEEPWSLEIRNLGPAQVTKVDKQQFAVSLSVGRTVHVVSNGSMYVIR